MTLARSAAEPVKLETAVASIGTVVSLASISKSAAETVSLVMVNDRLLATSGFAGVNVNKVAISLALTVAVITPVVCEDRVFRSVTLSVPETVTA